MLDFLIDQQYNLMLILQGICLVIAILTLITKNLTLPRKIAIFLLEINAFCMLTSSRLCALYDGSTDAFYGTVVQLARFCDYLFSLTIAFCFNLYLKDLLKHEGSITKLPLRIYLVDAIVVAGIITLIVSHFTGFYYTFDEQNRYQRAPGRAFSYIFTFAALIVQLSCLLQYYKRLPKFNRFAMLLAIVGPLIAAFLQFYFKGFKLAVISSVDMAILLYVFAIQEMNETIERSHRLEIEMLEQYKEKLEKTVEKRTHELRIANEKAENLLLNILPENVARELTEHPDKTISQKYPNTTVLFTDIVGFTKMSSNMTAEQTVTMLNQIISLFDERASREGIEKIKTIGDAYMAATGLTEDASNDGAQKMIHFAQGLLEDVKHFNESSSTPIQIRIGINSGELVAGVIGKTKFIYDIWGDTVNVASRMESSGNPMQIHIAESTYQQTKQHFAYSQPIQVELKGKGLMNGYFL